MEAMAVGNGCSGRCGGGGGGGGERVGQAGVVDKAGDVVTRLRGPQGLP